MFGSQAGTSASARTKKFSLEHAVYLANHVRSLCDALHGPAASRKMSEPDERLDSATGDAVSSSGGGVDLEGTDPTTHFDPCSDVEEEKRYEVVCGLVDALREFVEVVVWGDKHDESVFFVFLERDCMQWLEDLVIDAAVPAAVKVQVIQCVTILLQNLTHQSSVFVVCSNNHINRMIQLDLTANEDEEELMSIYTSFLKSICLRLNNESVQFFFQSSSDVQQQQKQHHGEGVVDDHVLLAEAFPLLAQSMKLLQNSDSLVRAAARQIVITVMQLQDENVVKFMESPGVMERVFATVVAHMRHQVQEIAERMRKRVAMSANGVGVVQWTTLGALDTAVEDLLDDFYYLNDLAAVPLSEAFTCLFSTLKRDLCDALLLPPLVAACHQNEDAASSDVPPLLSLFILGHWAKLNTVVAFHKYLLDELFFNAPLRATSNDDGVDADCGVVAHLLAAPRLHALHGSCLYIIHSIWCTKLLSDEERKRLATGSLSTKADADTPEVRDRKSPSEVLKVAEWSSVKASLLAAYVPLDLQRGRTARLVEAPRPLRNHGVNFTVSPLMKAIAASLKDQVACKELTRLNVLTLTLALLIHAAQTAFDEQESRQAWLQSQLLEALDQAQLHLVQRVEMYRQHLWVLFGSMGESTVLTPSSLLCQLLSADTEKEFDDPYEALYVRIDRDAAAILSTFAAPNFHASLSTPAATALSTLTALHKSAKDIALLAPLMPPLACWNAAVSDRLTYDIRSGDKNVSWYLDLQQRNHANVALPRRAPQDEDEVEYVEVAVWLLLRHVVFTQVGGLPLDPLVDMLQAFSCRRRAGEDIRSWDLAASSITEPGVRCEYTPDAHDHPLVVVLQNNGAQWSVTPGSAVYLFVHDSDVFLIEPSRDAPDTKGVVVAAFRAIFTEAYIHKKQLFKLQLVQDAPTTKLSVCVVLRDRAACQQVARRVQHRAAELRRDVCALLHGLLIHDAVDGETLVVEICTTQST